MARKCCSPVCDDCTERAESILVTFSAGDSTWVTNCFVCNTGDCDLYAGSTYELPMYQYNPPGGIGPVSSCIYRLDPSPECDSHYIQVIVFTTYASGSYYSTTYQAGIYPNFVGSCSNNSGTLEVLATEENPIDCDADRVINLPDNSGSVFFANVCDHTNVTATISTPP